MTYPAESATVRVLEEYLKPEQASFSANHLEAWKEVYWDTVLDEFKIDDINNVLTLLCRSLALTQGRESMNQHFAALKAIKRDFMNNKINHIGKVYHAQYLQAFDLAFAAALDLENPSDNV
ncbi:hypothetical protein HRE53_32815 (plasmid) [Acaryochloris sp. 'Moss Beach']|uniref:hypothetical protein n=1 Tax=Acaryochloris sp. 'Moss Beach' TaxID=2740837 RepID=UPI001F397621|nr:hypothetical protein [Acaryochloris sp. 'Moss Beach']UJB73417.1 hypothetical protein HRE53_32815 [Acaryochloris sp. 'Moss Beach']